MKAYFLFFFMFIAFSSCTKNEDPTIDIVSSEWFLERSDIGGGSVHLKLTGSTNADQIKIKTFGDGIISWQSIELDQYKNFDKDITISFSATAVPEEEFIVTTEAKVFKGTKILTIPLMSDTLKY